jgi:hypothetical protein
VRARTRPVRAAAAARRGAGGGAPPWSDEGPFGTVITAATALDPGHFRPFIVPVGAFGVVHADRIAQIPTAWLIRKRGAPAPAALAEVDRHLATLFLC